MPKSCIQEGTGEWYQMPSPGQACQGNRTGDGFQKHFKISDNNRSLSLTLSYQATNIILKQGCCDTNLALPLNVNFKMGTSVSGNLWALVPSVYENYNPSPASNSLVTSQGGTAGTKRIIKNTTASKEPRGPGVNCYYLCGCVFQWAHILWFPT